MTVMKNLVMFLQIFSIKPIWNLKTQIAIIPSLPPDCMYLRHFKEQSSLSWLHKLDVVGKKIATWDRSKKKNPGRILVVDE